MSRPAQAQQTHPGVSLAAVFAAFAGPRAASPPLPPMSLGPAGTAMGSLLTRLAFPSPPNTSFPSNEEERDGFEAAEGVDLGEVDDEETVVGQSTRGPGTPLLGGAAGANMASLLSAAGNRDGGGSTGGAETAANSPPRTRTEPEPAAWSPSAARLRLLNGSANVSMATDEEDNERWEAVPSAGPALLRSAAWRPQPGRTVLGNEEEIHDSRINDSKK
ncbi:hypothetical protein DFJ74DRAFT_118933 [Hyaloraphidium curvatum]|nr:hypothetical protein DFJ74DRAFT_118933 [Hyaloraphidium curvatum]